VIRLFNVYYPVRTLVLLVGEALIVGLSFILGTFLYSVMLVLGDPENSLRFKDALFIEGGYFRIFELTGYVKMLGPYGPWRILAVTGVVLMLSHGSDLYDSGSLGSKWDQRFRVLRVLVVVAFSLAAIDVAYLIFLPRRVFLPGANWGVLVLAIAFLGWRGIYSWILQWPFFRERVYVLGTGDRAQRLLNGLRQRSELGIEVVGWTGNIVGELTQETVAADLMGLAKERGVNRVIVAMPDRRRTLPVQELLELRLNGVKVEEATSWLERISGRIEVEQLYPSWLIFAEGFRFSGFFRLVRRSLNFSLALIGLVLALPLLPFIMLAVKLGSAGPVFYGQQRVGRRGEIFYCYKFRTMRQDAEADTGATWALDDDPRITRVGKFLRSSRLDEIPQLWCVLKGDMHFVGPRPERPEFVEWLTREIPYYYVRHMVRPGITGWAQVQYKYGNTLEDAREKLQYDLFYIKNASIGLDFLILFQTIKIVLLGRGAQ
jgi:sugar transferase (PEP-CTERM system associated)